MIYIRVDYSGYRHMNNGIDGPKEGDFMTDQYIAILMGWAIGIMESGK